MSAVVSVRNLTRRFGSITAVNDLSFDVRAGEVLGFLGPNGAGKSTTMKMITGFLAPDAGGVSVDGVDIADDAVAVKQRIGYLPEGAPLYPDMTPTQLLEFVGAVRGLHGAALADRIQRVVEQVNLGSVLEQPIDTLSKGFKRRVGLAQAILHDPDILILDEPTDGLDPNQKHEVRRLIRTMAATKVIILSTHILEEVDAVCTRAVIINRGKIVADGTPAELHARSPYHNAVDLRLRDADPGVKSVLTSLADVAEVRATGDGDECTDFVVMPKNGRNIMPVVSRAARDNGWLIDEIRVREGRLDEVFRDLTLDARIS